MCESEFDLIFSPTKNLVVVYLVLQASPMEKPITSVPLHTNEDSPFIRPSVIHSFIHSAFYDARSLLSWYRKDIPETFEGRTCFFFLFRPSLDDSHSVRKMESKGNLGLSIKSFTGSVGSRDREEKERSQRQKTKRKEIKESVITRTVIQLCIKSRTREEIWTVSSLLSFVAQESHRQSR